MGLGIGPRTFPTWGRHSTTEFHPLCSRLMDFKITIARGWCLFFRFPWWLLVEVLLCYWNRSDCSQRQVATFCTSCTGSESTVMITGMVAPLSSNFCYSSRFYSLDRFLNIRTKGLGVLWTSCFVFWDVCSELLCFHPVALQSLKQNAQACPCISPLGDGLPSISSGPEGVLSSSITQTIFWHTLWTCICTRFCVFWRCQDPTSSGRISSGIHSASLRKELFRIGFRLVSSSFCSFVLYFEWQLCTCQMLQSLICWHILI